MKKEALLLNIILLFFILAPAYHAQNLNPGDFSYVHTINISADTPLTDFQFNVTLDTESLIAAEMMDSSCADIRITDNQWSNMPIFVEDCNTSSTQVWFKSNLSANASFFLFYGNDSLQSVSDPSSVFDFYDDFDILNSSVWDIHAAAAVDGAAHVYNNNNGWWGIFSKQTFNPGTILEFEVKYDGDLGDQGSALGGFWEYWLSGQRTTFYEYTNDWRLRAYQETTASSASLLCDMNAGGVRWSLMRITWLQDSTKYYQKYDGGSCSGEISSYNPQNPLKIAFAVSDTSSSYGAVEMRVYWVRTRKVANVSIVASLDNESATSAYATCPDGIVSYWTFDNISGTTVYDQLAVNPGTLIGSAQSAGFIGDALDMTSSNDYMTAQNPVTSNDYTIVAWFKPTQLSPSTSQYLVWFGTPTSYESGVIHLRTDQIGYAIYGRGEPIPIYAATGTLNSWHFVAITSSTTTQSTNIYYDGQFIGNGHYGLSAYTSGLTVGARISNSGNNYLGYIDELAFFDRPLTGSEINLLYTKALLGKDYCAEVSPIYTNFTDPETTNFSAEPDPTNVTTPALATAEAKIQWSGSGYNVANQNLDQSIHFAHNFVSVDSSTLPTFNRSANITLKTVSYPSLMSYDVLKNGHLCTTCVKYSSNPVKFKVTGFSNYTTNSTGTVPEFSSNTILVLGLFIIIALFLLRKHKN